MVSLQDAVAQYAANQTRNTRVNPFSFRYVHWILLRALHDTRDPQLYAPSKGRSIRLSALLKDTDVTTGTRTHTPLGA